MTEMTERYRTGKEHDFRKPKWGWALQTSMLRVLEPGKFSIPGHGYGIRKGDWIRICSQQKPAEGRKYLVEDISYYSDPKDMFKVVLVQDDFDE
jgi:hypothetical protein